jgi:hypothetical protein
VIDARVPLNVPPQIAATLTEALKDLGARERGLPNRGPMVDKFQPEHIRQRAQTEGVPWCASAVCTWWRVGFGLHPLGAMIRGADKLKDVARTHGMWRDVPTQPRPGDAFVLLHGADTKGFDKGHTGLVLRVSADGRTIQTIEGNARNAVRLIERSVPDVATPNQILGFAAPVADAAWFGRDWQRGLLLGVAETPGGSTR